MGIGSERQLSTVTSGEGNSGSDPARQAQWDLAMGAVTQPGPNVLWLLAQTEALKRIKGGE